MKVWQGYGSEHSMNLVMIGHFKQASDAKKAHGIIEALTKSVTGKTEFSSTRYDDDILNLMQELNCHSVGPGEVEQFQYDVRTELERNKIVITTEENDVSAFLKIMLDRGARIEVYSAHDYPDSTYGRGK